MSEEQAEFKVTDRRGQAKEVVKAKEPEPDIVSSVKTVDGKKNKTSPMFSNLLMSLSTSALMYLGAIPDPTTGEMEVNPEAAQQQVELLTMLKEKTEGNRSPEENKLLEEALYELHLRFVQLSKARTPGK